MAISATEKPLGKVFTSDYQLTIPSFQRAYTWQAENIEQLVNDLQYACADPDTQYWLPMLPPPYRIEPALAYLRPSYEDAANGPAAVRTGPGRPSRPVR